jgi:hypothetical protein
MAEHVRGLEYRARINCILHDDRDGANDILTDSNEVPEGAKSRYWYGGIAACTKASGSMDKARRTRSHDQDH